MKTHALSTLLALLFLIGAAAPSALAVDLNEVEKLLTTTGVEGEVHGASPAQGLYVFTYRNPKDFFDYVEMSLVGERPDVLQKLEALSRHDRVRVRGKFMKNPSPQKHIAIESIDVLTQFESPYPAKPYEYEAKIPDELQHQSSALFLVHAIAGEGHILVTEYKDAVLPIFVKNAELTKNLFRGDVVRLVFRIQKTPDQPVHLRLEEGSDATESPLRVIESIQAKNGKAATIEGALVFFPKSPQILFNVFAVLEPLPGGLNRQYTLVNMTDPQVFKQLREALQKAWDKYPGAYVNGRNKLVSTRLRVRATGLVNEVSPAQANPQILLNSIDALQILEN